MAGRCTGGQSSRGRARRTTGWGARGGCIALLRIDVHAEAHAAERPVPRDRLDDAALAVAGEIATKDTRVIRAAKEALNGIDPVDVNKSYRFEQGFTMELNLAGVSDELRDTFAGTDKAGRR